MAEIASAYIALLPSLRGNEKLIGQQLGSPTVQKQAAGAGEKAGGKMSAGIGKALKAGVAALGIAGIGAGVAVAFGDALEKEKLGDKTAASLGLTQKQSRTAGKVAGQLYANAYGESMGDTTDAVENVMSSIEGMSSASPKKLKAVTEAALNIATAFDVDVEQAATNAGILMKTGLAPNATAAMDLITASLQQVPKSLRGEVMDATQEYSDSFSALGLTGEQTMGLLVSASENGQYGIDKMGDAIKEFTIRGTDMSKATVAAYDAIGLNAGKTTDDLLAGGDRANGAFTKIVEGVKGIKDPTERSQAALALFGTPLEDLGTKDIPKFLDSLTSSKTALKDTKGAAKEMGDTLNDNLGSKIEGWKRSIQTFASDGLLALIQGFQDGKGSGEGFAGVMSNVGGVIKNVTTWVGEHKTLVLTLVGAWAAWKTGVVVHSTALKVHAAVTKAWATATKVAAVAQRVLNVAMKANPIGLIITAVTALVGVLVWFFTKTKTGKAIVAAAWAGIKTAIKAVSDWWTKTAWPAIKKVITALHTAFTAAKTKITSAWNLIKAGISAGWTWIRDNVFAKLKAGLGAVKDKFTSIKTVIKTVWGNLGTILRAGWTWIKDNVFGKFKDGLTSIKTAFTKVKDGIKVIWDKLKAIAAKPVNFILGTVYNDGIAHWWNTIVNGLKLPQGLKLPAAKLLKFAQGGVLPGYTPGRDVHEFYSPTGGRLSLSGGEAIMRPEFTRAVGGAAGVARLNAAARHGQAFADGGVWNWVGDKWSKAWRGGVNLAGDMWEKAKKLGGDIWAFVKDPVGSITRGLGSKVKDWLAGLPGGEIAAAFGTMPAKIVGGLADTVKKHFTAGSPTDGGGSGGKGLRGNLSAMAAAAKAFDPSVRVTSGYRPGAMTVTGVPSMHGAGRAIDMVASNMGALWDKLYATYGKASPELFFSGRAFSRFGKKGAPRNDHWDHVHWAMKTGGIVPKLYDGGGMLNPGDVGLNFLDRPEAVLTPDETDLLKELASGSAGGDHIEINANDPYVVLQALEMRKRRSRARANLLGV
ncbi:phage tail tape measure protein [Isoptericola sp. NPDC056618]|uniref:phage tail tape measure protein n=1 Tax=Isoptericola sp. NPDC056618 TaxID=3345878 RepID=UPI0036A38C58